MKKIMVLSLLIALEAYAMQDEHINELYKLCQVWFTDHHIATIASHISNIQNRKGSFIAKKGALEVRATHACALFNAEQECVNVHKIVFPGVTLDAPVAILTFDEILKMKVLIEAKNRK